MTGTSGTNWTAPATVASTGGGAPTLTNSGSQNVSQFGTFDLTYSSGNSSPSGLFTGATINLTNVTANTLADLLSPNFAEAHVYCPTTGKTGFASVPIPPSALLMGSGLLGLGLLRWRRKQGQG